MPECWGKSFKGKFSMQCQYAALFTQSSKRKRKIQYLFPCRILHITYSACVGAIMRLQCSNADIFYFLFPFSSSCWRCVFLSPKLVTHYTFLIDPPGLLTCKQSIRTVMGFYPVWSIHQSQQGLWHHLSAGHLVAVITPLWFSLSVMERPHAKEVISLLDS